METYSFCRVSGKLRNYVTEITVFYNIQKVVYLWRTELVTCAWYLFVATSHIQTFLKHVNSNAV